VDRVIVRGYSRPVPWKLPPRRRWMPSAGRQVRCTADMGGARRNCGTRRAVAHVAIVDAGHILENAGMGRGRGVLSGSAQIHSGGCCEWQARACIDGDCGCVRKLSARFRDERLRGAVSRRRRTLSGSERIGALG
jgi:hypothetical protein